MKRLISFIGRKLDMDAEYFIGNSFLLFSRYAFLACLALIMNMVFSRYISKEVYGDYQLILSFIATVGFFSLPGFNKAIWTDASNGKDGSLTIATTKKMKWSLLGSLVLTAVALKYYIDGNYIFTLAIISTAICFPLYSGADIWSGFLDSKKKYKLSTVLLFATNLLSKLGIILAIIFFKESLLFLVILSTVSVSITNYIGIKIAEREKKNELVSEDFLHYGFFITKTVIIENLLKKIDSILIGIFMGPAYLAIYAFASVIPEQLGVLITTVTDVVIPKLGENTQHAVQAKIKEKIMLIIGINIILIIAVIFLTPFAVRILFTEKYADSVFYSQIITASLFVYVFEVLYSRILLVNKRKLEILKTSTIIPIFRSVIVIVSFVWFGILGVAISNIITRVFNIMIYWYYAMKTGKSGIEKQTVKG